MPRKLYLVCLLTYSAVVAWFTLRSLPSPDGTPDFIPFLDTWKQLRDHGSRSTLREVGSNFALFVPLGLFLGAVLPRPRRLGAVVAIAGLASIAIEVGQWLVIAGRHPSVDDVIYNTAGAAAGAIVFILLRGAWLFRRGHRVAAKSESAGATAP